MPGEPTPLRNLPIEIFVDGVPITGLITALYPNDLTVEITQPVKDLRTGVHVPHFAMYPQNRLATYENGKTTAITERGRQRAEDLLRVLYEYSRGSSTGWSVEEKRSGRWVRTKERR
jgi:hypothetical protein